ncbi:MAG: hypothetical protein IJX66_10980 [Lachnospiraceae bacterium]|nr:hypothetical protein [Lachnospiraceae bacterium]
MLEMREMKEAYVTPEMEIVSFETEDVITASGGLTDPIDPNDPWELPIDPP